MKTLTSPRNCFTDPMWWPKTLVGVLSMAKTKDEVRETLLEGEGRKKFGQEKEGLKELYVTFGSINFRNKIF